MIRILLDSAENAFNKIEERRKLILRSLEETYGYKEPEPSDASTSGGTTTSTSTSSISGFQDPQKQDDALRIRLEAIGYKVGSCLAER